MSCVGAVQALRWFRVGIALALRRLCEGVAEAKLIRCGSIAQVASDGALAYGHAIVQALNQTCAARAAVEVPDGGQALSAH